jgi:hypothetical protein
MQALKSLVKEEKRINQPIFQGVIEKDGKLWMISDFMTLHQAGEWCRSEALFLQRLHGCEDWLAYVKFTEPKK